MLLEIYLFEKKRKKKTCVKLLRLCIRWMFEEVDPIT